MTDDRSSGFGSSLTATSTDLQSPLLAFLDAGALSITPACQGLPGSAAGATAGDANQTLDNAVTLCIKDTQTSGGTTNGEWDITGDLVASLPPFLAARAVHQHHHDHAGRLGKTGFGYELTPASSIQRADCAALNTFSHRGPRNSSVVAPWK